MPLRWKLAQAIVALNRDYHTSVPFRYYQTLVCLGLVFYDVLSVAVYRKELFTYRALEDVFVQESPIAVIVKLVVAL